MFIKNEYILKKRFKCFNFFTSSIFEKNWMKAHLNLQMFLKNCHPISLPYTISTISNDDWSTIMNM